VRTDFSPDALKLFEGVPAEAFAVGFVDSGVEVWSYLLRGLIYELSPDERAPLDQELRTFLSARMGLDMTKVKSAVVFGMGAKPDGAVLVGGVGGEMKARVAGKHGDASLLELSPDGSVMAARRGDVLVIGSGDGVRAALDALSGKRDSLAKKEPEAWKWIQAECGGAFIGAATGALSAGPPEMRGMAEQTGIERACVRLDGRGLRGVLVGDEAKLAQSAQMVKAGLGQQLAMAEAMKSKGTAPGAPTVEGLSAILGYHYMKSAFAKLQPEPKNGRLEVDLPLALGDSGFIVAFIGVAAAVAIPAFMKYIKKSKTSEARQMIKKMYDGARAYYMDNSISTRSMNPPVAQFPEPSVGPTPPLGTCCKTGEKCAPDAAQWMANTWVALMFSVDDPHYYSYQYEVIDKQREFVVRAFGDLDCDGEYSTFEMHGIVDPNTGEPSGSPMLMRISELE